MELDDMKTAWRELDRRIDAGAEVDRRIWKELKLEQTRSTLSWLAGWPLLELVIDILAVLLVGAFLAGHIHAARYAVPAIMLQVAAILKLSATIRQLAMIARIDYAAPVVAIQRQLAALRALRGRTTMWIFLLALLLWTPLAIVGAKALLGLDLYRAFGPLWIALNVALGVAVIPLAIWIARRHAGWFRNSRVMQQLADDIAGRSLTRATGHLDEITRFEDER